MQKKYEYKQRLSRYLRTVQDNFPNADMNRLEHHFECLEDWNIFNNIDQVKAWFEKRRKDCKMEVKEIPLSDCKGWSVNIKTKKVSHDSGEFFSIHGIRVNIDSREVGKGGWDQPILTQIGFDGGLLGVIRQRFDGVPHYLIEAKAEPGNYEKVQLSPTLQATFSNLRRAHKGRKPSFSEFFESPETHQSTVLFNQWLSEDGGRLYLKRNKGMLVEVPEGTIGKLPDGFIWLSMWQIKHLLLENAWVNPHIRGIISYL